MRLIRRSAGGCEKIVQLVPVPLRHFKCSKKINLLSYMEKPYSSTHLYCRLTLLNESAKATVFPKAAKGNYY